MAYAANVLDGQSPIEAIFNVKKDAKPSETLS